MSRSFSLFAPPVSFINAANRLSRRQQNGKRVGISRARNLLYVELAFRLFERLNVSEEPVTAPWAILSGMPIYEPRLVDLDREGRRSIANARQLIPYSARFAWLNALRSYRQLEPAYCHYLIDELDWHRQSIDVAKKQPDDRSFDPSREALYDEWLTNVLDYRRRTVPPVADSSTAYTIEAVVLTEQKQIRKTPVPLVLDAKWIDNVPRPPSVWFPKTPNRTPFTIRWTHLGDDAVWVKQREDDLQKQVGSPANDWVRRFNNVRLRSVLPDKSVGKDAPDALTADGFMHLAGMVASGKSTLATLLAVHVVRHRPQDRLTLVVGDVQSAIRLANQLNTWFCNDPETDVPVAVPLFGRSSRNNHIHTFYKSEDYRQYTSRQQPHWGERWLGSICPLQASLRDSDVTNLLQGQLLITGKEPCQRLKPSGESEDDPVDNDDEEVRRKPKHCACPFLGTCPQYQALRDMPNAPVWITTPGGLGAQVPTQFDDRPVTIWEVVYEQSSLVIFDEADAVMNWFDNQFAETLTLTGSPDSVLDKVAVPATRYAIANRVMPSATARWIGSQGSAQQAVSAMLTMLDPFQGRACIRQWVSRHYFTPLRLFDRLSYRLAGLEEIASPTLTDLERTERDERVEPIRHLFEPLLDDDDRLQNDPQRNEALIPASQLSRIMSNISPSAESATSPAIHAQCVRWITQYVPDIDQRLDALRKRLAEQQAQSVSTRPKRKKKAGKKATDDDDPVDTIAKLAYRLQFALTVLLLDQHNRTVLHEWENRPHTIQDESPTYRRNTVLRSLLPLPLTGRQFGTYYARGDADSEQKRRSDSPPVVSLFAYTNIGRTYLLNFHRLLTDNTGQRGPNVIAMSGTSYLPDSTTFHLNTPQALLIPTDEAVAAIEKSVVRFCPQRIDGTPIRVSGNLQHAGASVFMQLTQALAGPNKHGLLPQALNELEDLARTCPAHWQDRQRLLLFVNSYEQAYWAAAALREALPSQKEAIYSLVNDASPYQDQPHALPRTDIEQFAQINARILIAPLSAVGRGFNMLNQYNNTNSEWRCRMLNIGETHQTQIRVSIGTKGFQQAFDPLLGFFQTR